MKKARKKGLLPIGKVRRAHGIRGALEIFLYSRAYEGIRALDQIILAHPGESGQKATTFEIKRVRKKKEGRVILELGGLEDRTTAESYRGCELLCRDCDLPPLDEDEFYWFEVEGFSVVDVDGNRLGKVTGCMATKGHDLLVCQGESGEFLVPVVGEISKEIRRQERTIVIDPPPGLLEANAL